MAKINVSYITNQKHDFADIFWNGVRASYYIEYNGTIIANGYFALADAVDDCARKMKEYMLMKNKDYFIVGKNKK